MVYPSYPLSQLVPMKCHCDCQVPCWEHPSPTCHSIRMANTQVQHVALWQVSHKALHWAPEICCRYRGVSAHMDWATGPTELTCKRPE